MKKFKFLLIVIAIVCIALGVVFTVKAVKTHAFVDDSNIVTNEYSFDEEVNDLDIKISTANLEFVLTTDTKVSVKCVEKEKDYHEVKVEDNTLKIKSVSTRKWYESWFDWNNTDLKVTVSLPKNSFNSLRAESSTGEIIIDGFDFNEVKIKVSTGDIKYSNSKANTINAELSTGFISLNNVISDTLTVKSSTGDIVFKDCDANTIKMKASTGDIRGNFLTGKKFTAKASTGRVSVPQSSEGGSCDLETSTGDIIVEVK